MTYKSNDMVVSLFYKYYIALNVGDSMEKYSERHKKEIKDKKLIPAIIELTPEELEIEVEYI